MAASDSRSADEVRREIEAEREQLAGAAESLRDQLGEATDITSKLKANLPAAAGGALFIGFVITGGIGATARLIFRKSREGETVATFGRFRLVDRE